MTKRHTLLLRLIQPLGLGVAALFLAVPLSAQLVQNAFFSVSTPPDHYQTKSTSLIVAGKFAKPVDRIEIDGQSATIEKNNSFHLQVSVKPGESRLTISAFQGKKMLKTDRLTITSIAANSTDKTPEAPAVVVANSGEKPSIQIEGPDDKSSTDQNFVLIEGTVKDAVELRINNHRVPIFQGGRFVSKEPLPQPNIPTTFVVVAKNKAGVEITERRTVTGRGTGNANIAAIKPVIPTPVVTKPTPEPTPVKKMPTPAPEKKPEIATETPKLAAAKPGPQGNGRPSSASKLESQPKVPVVLPDRQPVITFFSPDANYFSRGDKVLVKGRAEYAHTVMINDVPVRVGKSGRFHQVVTLPKRDQYFEISAVAKSRKGKVAKSSRRIFYQYSDIAFSPATPKRQAGSVPAPEHPIADSNVPSASAISTQPMATAPAVDELNWVYPKTGTRTSAALISVYGTVKPNSQLQINDQSVPVQSDGKFKIEIPVQAQPAENRIHLQATLPGGKVIDMSRKIVFDSGASGIQAEITSPKLSIFEPTPFGLTTKDSVFVSGKVENASMVMINDRRVVPKPDGLFSEKFALTTFGKLMFNVIAIGADGQTATQKIQITRNQPGINSSSKPAGTPATVLQSQLNRRISLELTDSPIKEVLKILAKKGDLNIVADKSLSGSVTISINDLTIINAINLILNSQGLSYQIIDNTILVAPAESLKKATTLDTKVIYLKNIQSDRVETIVKDRLSQSESIQTLPQDNVVIITADPKKLQQLADLVVRLDSVKTSQVVIEAQIIETSTSAMEGLGVAWPSSVGGSLSISKTDGTNTVKADTSISAIVNALASQGKAKILARPRIKAVDGQSANIFIGDKVPYIETNEDSTGKISETVKFVDAGITLKILPSINTQDQEVKIKIEPEVSSIFGWRGKNADVPWVKTRKVDTTVSVKNNETVVIGGLFNSSDSADQTRVPLLGDIPILGSLFTNNKTDQNLSQLVITITPRIINSGDSDFRPAEANTGY